MDLEKFFEKGNKMRAFIRKIYSYPRRPGQSRMTRLAVMISSAIIISMTPFLACQIGDDAPFQEAAQTDQRQTEKPVLTGSGSPYQLVGKTAPDFEISLLDGSTLKLSDHFGRHIIILDFWASWCKPCTIALPVMGKVSDQLKEKGVVFYAVNMKENLERVQKFVRAEGYLFPIALDRTGDVAAKYHVRPIPQTVLIDRDGKVAKIHIGFHPKLEEFLTEEIQKLLSRSSEKPVNPGGSTAPGPETDQSA